MEGCDGMGKEVSNASNKTAVRRKILIPILLATVVTVFSLHYYNQRHVERLLSKKTKMKHANDAPGHHHTGRDSLRKLYRRDLNITHWSKNGAGASKPGHILRKWRSKPSVSAERMKMRHDINTLQPVTWNVHNARRTLKGAGHPIHGKFFLNALSDGISSITTEATVTAETSKSKNQKATHIPSIGRQFKNPHSSTENSNTGSSRAYITTTPDSSNETKARSEMSTWTTKHNWPKPTQDVLYKEANHAMNDYKGHDVKSEFSLAASTWHAAYNRSRKASWSLRIADRKALRGTNGKLSISGHNKSKSVHIGKQKRPVNKMTSTVSSGFIFQKRQLLETPYSLNRDNSKTNPHDLQILWDKSLHTLSEHVKKEVAPPLVSNTENAKQLLNALASMHMPLNHSDTSFNSEGTTSKQVSGDSHVQTTSVGVKLRIVTNFPLEESGQIAKQQLVTKLHSDKIPKSAKRWPVLTPPPTPLTVNLQQIWDDSVRELESKEFKDGFSQLTQNMDQRKYSSDKLSLQEIWDESIFGNVPVRSNRKEPVGKDGAKPTKNPTQLMQHGGHSISSSQYTLSKARLTHGQVVVGDQAPDVSLSSVDLPLKSMRSKVMSFSYKPVPGKKYAVLSVSVMQTDYNYAFTVPLTVLAWQRIGYGVIVFIVGTEENWISNPILHYILKELRRLDPIVLFFNAPKDNGVFFSQVARIFASNAFDWRGMEMTPLVMSDTDIWPLTKEMYDIPEGKKILSLNSECCGSFKHRDHTYKMVPLCNVVMSINTWRELIGRRQDGSLPISTSDIRNYFRAEFGEIVTQVVNKGENDGWFLDQHMISMRIAQWGQRHGREFIQYAPRDVGRDRVDRSHWFPYRITRMNDIHMLENLYQPGTWERALPLLRQMFNEKTNRELDQYRDGFIRMLVNYKIPT